jgi:hypothetical protein
MMGREMLPVPAVPAGCVCGVGGLEQHVLKYATLASSRVCRPLSFMTFQVARPPGLVPHRRGRAAARRAATRRPPALANGSRL